MEFLKEVLGDELYGEVKGKLEGQEGIKLANLAEGGYVSREKYAALEAQAGADKKTLEEQQGILQEFKELKTAYNSLKEKYDTDIAGFALQQESRDKSHAIDMALLLRQAKNIKAARALLDMDKISYENGTLKGFDEQINQIEEANSYLFGGETKTSTGMRHSGKGQGSHAFLQTIYENQAKRN